jgi:hypothetical protein
MTNVSKKTKMDDVQSHISESFDFINKYLPDRYVSLVQEKLIAKGAKVPARTGFTGPYMMEYLYLDEIIRFMEADTYYVIKHDPARRSDREFTFKLILRPANSNDFKWSPRYPRYFRIYWLRLDETHIQGPLYFMPGTDREKFSAQLQAGQLYVPNERQDFTAWQASSAAS